jgi:hypothetical protein
VYSGSAAGRSIFSVTANRVMGRVSQLPQYGHS